MMMNKLTQRDKEEIFNLWVNGESRDEIGEIYSMSPAMVNYTVNKHVDYAKEVIRLYENRNAPLKDRMVKVRSKSVQLKDFLKGDYTRIDKYPMTSRLYNCLKNTSIETMHDLSMVSDDELMRIPNMGKKSMSELNEIVQNHRRDTTP